MDNDISLYILCEVHMYYFFLTKMKHFHHNKSMLLMFQSQMCYLFEGMTWDAGAFSSEKGKDGVRGQ
jgi:hypothetical protein